MKKFLSIAFSLTLLLSNAAMLYSRDCFSCSDDCSFNRDCGICPTNCDLAICDGYNSGCFDCNDCNSCESADCSTCCVTPVRTSTHFRSQGANTARELVGWQWELNRPFMCEGYGAAYFAYEFQRSFRPERLANAVFGGPVLKFSGSLAPNRQRDELLADNFGFSRNFRGAVRFCPKIENHIFDFGYYMGLDCLLQGSYLRIHAPIVISRWSLRASECVSSTSPDIDPCFVGDATETVAAAQTIQQALSGNFLFGDMQTPWCAGKFDFCRRSKTGLADIDFILGYNWFNTDCYHLGTYLQMVLPTGKRRKDLYVFDPVVGNGGHFELGGGISAHTVLWACGDHNLAVFLEGNITHMFNSRQCRLFDFCDAGAFSRYVLLKEYDSNGQYNGNLISATCFNNREVDVKVNVKGDVSVKLAYRWCNWGFDLGYNIYGHTDEKVKLKEDCCENTRKFAIKGTSPVCCFEQQVANVLGIDGNVVPTVIPGGTIATPQLLNPANCPGFPVQGQAFGVTPNSNNSAQPGATAFTADTVTPGTAGACRVCLNSPTTAPIAVGDLGDLGDLGLASNGLAIVNQASPQRFVSTGNFNIRSAEAVSVLTHKIFAHLNYTWYDNCGLNPHIGIGGEAEFDGRRHDNLNCKKAGLNQWGVWVKGGFSF